MTATHVTATQRLDKWLWQTRFFKTRSLAQRMCNGGKIRINSRRVRKAHYALKAGDILTFPQGSRIRVVRILAMPSRRGPAVEAQAIDRVHRIGQTRNVFAYRMICRGTVEEKILQLQGKKRALAESIITADNSLIKDMGQEDLEFLLS